MENQEKISVLFVCMGNICRSPIAQGVFDRLVKEAGLEHCITIDSAGTHAYHVGNPPDKRACSAALRRGIDISDQEARSVDSNDFHRFDYVVAMDRDNYSMLQFVCPGSLQHKLRLFLDFAPSLKEREVPDPYYGGDQGFERVLDLAEHAAGGLLEHLRRDHGL